MPGKKDEKNVRRWTKEEVEKFSEVLADPANGFVFALNKLALKKSSNNELYDLIKKSFVEQLTKKELIELNELFFVADILSNITN